MKILIVLKSHDQRGIFSKRADWSPYIQVEGKLVTGQNPASSAAVAEALM